MEWPTVAVASAIAAGLAATFALHERLPAVVEIVVLGVLAAWYGSLQHEVIHGHPTPWPRVNTALAIVPLDLVVPFRSYRTLHVAHHQTPDLTDPDDDPESWYVTAETWASAGRVQRWYISATRTLLGRLVLGPPVVAARWLAGGVRNAAHAGDRLAGRRSRRRRRRRARRRPGGGTVVVDLRHRRRVGGRSADDAAVVRRASDDRRRSTLGDRAQRSVLLAALPQQQPAPHAPRATRPAVVRAHRRRRRAGRRRRGCRRSRALHRLRRDRPPLPVAPLRHPGAGGNVRQLFAEAATANSKVLWPRVG